MISPSAQIKIKYQSSIDLNRSDDLNSNNLSISNLHSSKELAKKNKSSSKLKLPKIINRNNSDVNIYKDESFKKLYAEFKKHHKLRLKLFSPMPVISKKNVLEKKKNLISNLYYKKLINLNKKIEKPKLSERDLKDFEPKKYQINLLRQMCGSVDLNSVLDLKNKYIKLNNKFIGKNNNLRNRWINLALKEESILPFHLLKKFCEVGNEKNEDNYLW